MALLNHPDLPLSLLLLDDPLIDQLLLPLYHLVCLGIVPLECLPVPLPELLIVDLHVVSEFALRGHSE